MSFMFSSTACLPAAAKIPCCWKPFLITGEKRKRERSDPEGGRWIFRERVGVQMRGPSSNCRISTTGTVSSNSISATLLLVVVGDRCPLCSLVVVVVVVHTYHPTVLLLAEASTLHSVMAIPETRLLDTRIIVPIPVLGYQDCSLLESCSKMYY